MPRVNSKSERTKRLEAENAQLRARVSAFVRVHTVLMGDLREALANLTKAQESGTAWATKAQERGDWMRRAIAEGEGISDALKLEAKKLLGE